MNQSVEVESVRTCKVRQNSFSAPDRAQVLFSMTMSYTL